MAPRHDLAALKKARLASVGTAATEVAEEAAETERFIAGAKTGYATMKHAELHPDPDQPRRYFDPEDLRDLANSIKAYGGLEDPIVVYHSDQLRQWLIKHGERRWRAVGLLIEEGLPEVDIIPVRIVNGPKRDTEDTRRFRLAQSVSNEHQRLVALESAEQYLRIATEGLDTPMDGAQLAAYTGTDVRVCQKYLFVANALTPEERDTLFNAFPKAGLKQLEALVQWLNKFGEQLEPDTRSAAIAEFARVRPTAPMVGATLREFAPRKPAGRPARKQFSVKVDRKGAFEVRLRLPQPLTRDAAAIDKALADLDNARTRLQDMKAQLSGGE